MCNSSKSLLTYLIYDSYYIRLFFISAALKRIRVYVDELQGYIVNFGINVDRMLRHIIGVSSSVNIADIIEKC